MKKFIVSASAIALSLALFVVSCSKEQVTTTSLPLTNNNDKLITELHQVGQSYLQGVDMTKKKKWWQILGADLVGAVAGTLAGNLPGAIIGGAGASLAAIERVNPGGNGDDPKYNWAEKVDLTAPDVPGNRENPYNEVGVHHNELIAAMAKDLTPKAVLDDPSILIAPAAENLFDDYGADAVNLAVERVSPEWNALMDITNVSHSLPEMVAGAKDRGYISEFSAAILTEYVSVVEKMDDYTFMSDFTTEYENIIMNSELNDIDKTQVLQCLATARYSGAYWNSIFEQLEQE